MIKPESRRLTNLRRGVVVASALASMLTPVVTHASMPQYYYDSQSRLITSTTANYAIVNYYLDAAGNRSSTASQVFSSASYTNILNPGEAIFNDDFAISSDGRFGLFVQTDGNVVLYVLATGQVLWSTATALKTTVLLYMQGDGNLVLYGPQFSVLWSSGTSGHPGAGAVLQTDGNFVIYPNNGDPALWSSGTGGH